MTDIFGGLIGSDLIGFDEDDELLINGAPFIATGVTMTLRDSFDQAVAKSGVNLFKDYVFGTAAVTPAVSGVAIRNLSNLTSNFNPFQDGTGKININSELQIYQAFNSTNHAFATDRLNLTGVAPNGWAPLVTAAVGTLKLDGTANAIANCGLANTTGLRVGQVAMVQFKGAYYINAIVVDTSVSLTQLNSSPVTNQTNNLIAWLPIDSAPLSAQASSGQPVLAMTGAVPAAVQAASAGTLSMGWVGNGAVLTRNDDYRVSSATADAVTLDRNLVTTIVNAQRVLFYPPITSGQIWTQDHYDLSGRGGFFAVEGTLDLGDGRVSANADIHLVSTIAAFNALPTDFPWGMFTGFWAYGDSAGQFSHTSAEMDFFECYLSTTVGPNRWFGNNNSTGGGVIVYKNNNANGWTDGGSNFYVFPSGQTIMGRHKFQFIYTAQGTYRYLDGRLMQFDRYDWSSAELAQFGINLSVGTIAVGLGANFQFPMAATNFANMTYGIEEVKVWYRAP